MPTDSAAYGAVISRNVVAARARTRLKQSALAARMRALGYSWHPQTVGEIENGRRRVTADEILGLSYALETSIAALMMPTEDDKRVEFSAGHSVSVTSVRYSVIGYTDDSVRWAEDSPEFGDSGSRPVRTAPEWVYTLPTPQAPGFAAPAPESDDGA